MTTAAEVQAVIGQAIKTGMAGEARSRQSDAGIVGPSEIGFCRQKAALVIKGAQKSDSVGKWAAGVGTAIHSYVEDHLRGLFGDKWIIEGGKLTATLPSGAQISGTPDLIVPEWNAVLDLKTVDGFAWVKRNGVSQNHRYQRHLYAMGAIAAGLVDGSKEVLVGNVYLDRSGKEQDPHVILDPFDPTLTDEVDAWVTDVIYAVEHGEDASRDVAAPVCEQICEFYTACRGLLPAGDSEMIDDPELVDAVRMYVEGREMERESKRMKDAAKAMLDGLTGTTPDGWQVRTTVINGSEVPGYYREGGTRLDIRRVRGR